MAIREFSDAKGRAWRAWEIRPEGIHPVTKAEDYLADCYVTGWIVFETVSGDEKRRLCPWPTDWMTRSDAQLRELLALSEMVLSSRRADQQQTVAGAERSRTEPAARAKASDKLDVTDLHVIRTFKYPGGRYWTVGVVLYPEEGPPVLRFSAGMRSIDMKSWPKDWADQPDEALVQMLRSAGPRTTSQPPGRGIPLRRWDDPRDLRS